MHHVKHCDIQAFMTCHHEDVNDVVLTLKLLGSHQSVEIDEVFLSLLLSISHRLQFYSLLYFFLQTSQIPGQRKEANWLKQDLLSLDLLQSNVKFFMNDNSMFQKITIWYAIFCTVFPLRIDKM